uniref:Solute carrier family 2, facilitated glucose transporter member 8 n=1 Tax=Zea mays TaxID=4577 RepID=B6U615_MAIZE|nr:solute carrier family 2, facilitated glucose transporter member 8 [Zea mays]
MKLTQNAMFNNGNKLGSFFYQYLATISGCLSIICCGMHFGWPSPSLPELLDPNSTIPMTSEEGSWLAAMPCIGAPIGDIIAAYMADKIGRKYSMLITSPMYVASWLLVAFSPSVFVFALARIIAGAADGIAFTAFPMYLGEISDSKIRGILGSSIQVSMTTGMLLVNIIGLYLNISLTAIIALVFPVLHFITFWFMPESPYYLLMTKNTDAARRSLQIFNGTDDVDQKLKTVDQAVKEDLENTSSIWNLFTTKSNRKALLICFCLRSIQQFIGAYAITFYAKMIFDEAGENISASTATMIFFSVQLFVAIIASFLSDSLGRRPLLIISIIGSGIALAVEGLYFYFEGKIDMSGYSFVPLLALISYVIIYNVGVGCVPIILLGELFPPNVKAFALCLCDIWFDIVVTFMSKFFQLMKDNFGMHVPFFAFALFCGIGLVFIVLCVPETKGKTLEEIQLILKGKSKKNHDIELEVNT